MSNVSHLANLRHSPEDGRTATRAILAALDGIRPDVAATALAEALAATAQILPVARRQQLITAHDQLVLVALARGHHDR